MSSPVHTKTIQADEGEHKYALVWCPACNGPHMMGVGGAPGPNWQWNGDVDKPVFGPSLLVRSGHHVTGHSKEECKTCTEFPDAGFCTVCHSFIGCNGAQPGQIVYLSDCTHALAGKVVDLPPYPEDWK